jgi:hypothetical protein
MVRTMLWRKALPVTSMATSRSPASQTLLTVSPSTRRQVGLPTAEVALQKLLKSCSPTRAWAAAFMASTSSAPLYHQAWSHARTGRASPAAMR